MGRRARVGMAAAAVLLVAASATYLGVVLTSRVHPGSGWYGLDDASGTTIHQLVPDSRVKIAVSVRNPGPASITLDAVLIEMPELAIEDVTVMANSMRNPDCCRPERAEPFHPVKLATADEALVWLVLRLTGAGRYMPCSSFALDSVEVRYRVLGIPRTQRIELPRAVSFGSPCEQVP